MHTRIHTSLLQISIHQSKERSKQIIEFLGIKDTTLQIKSYRIMQ